MTGTFILQTLDESMEGIDEDIHVLINPDSESVPGGEGKMHSAMLQAIDSVKTQVEELKKSYKELTDLCQQKRDTFVLCMKFYMMTRQVSLSKEMPIDNSETECMMDTVEWLILYIVQYSIHQ